MPRTIDSTIPSLDKIQSFTKEDLQGKLPLPFQTLPSSSCQTLPETALHEIKSIVAVLEQHDIDSSLSSKEEDALDDGFILCDLNVIQRKLTAWYTMFPRIKPFFALKCNPDHMVAHVLGLNPDCGFDCASISEIKLALSSTGGDTRRCVYANPQRARDDLDQSLDLGTGALTFDGLEELHKVKDAYERRVERSREDEHGQKGESLDSLQIPLPPQMILRILVPDEHSSVPLGEKFGAPPDRVQILTEEAFKLGLDVIGVSFHCGSGCHDANAYGDAIRIAKDAIDVINNVIRTWNSSDGKDRQECTLLDIGGGYPGIDAVGADTHRFTSTGGSDLNIADYNANGDDGKATTYQISTIVTPLLDDLFPPDESPIRIISEPGRYFVEAAFVYCARIYSVKEEDQDGRRHYYIAQGVHGLFKDVLLCDESFTPTPLMINYEDGGASLDTKRSDEQDFDSVVHGPSGEDFDIVCKDCKLPKLSIGDFLIFDRMGAYTLSIAARNSSLPARYVFGGGER